MDHWAKAEQGAKFLRSIGPTIMKTKEQALEMQAIFQAGKDSFVGVQASWQKLKASIG